MEAYASGNWIVKQGKESEFIQKWRTWLESSRDSHEGLRWGKLLRAANDPLHFVSISVWEDKDAREHWMAGDEFKETVAGLRTLTDDFAGGGYDVVVAVDAKLTMAKMDGTA